MSVQCGRTAAPTCSETELWYLLVMCFLIVSRTDLTFLPSEMRDVAGDLTGSLMPSPSLFWKARMNGGV